MKAKLTKWFFVVAFLVLAGLHGFGVIEPSAIVMTGLYLCFAYLAFKADVTVKTKVGVESNEKINGNS